MEVKITYHNRDLRFTSDSASGEGFEDLFKFLQKNKNKISKLVILGETNSFTFMRQIYLFANTFRFISGWEIIINGKKAKLDQILLPVYKS